jgi:hypothetical protein
MPASPTCVPSISFVDCTSTVTCLTITLASGPESTHPDPPPPAEPPPTPTNFAFDQPRGSLIDHIVSGQPRPWSPTTPFEFPFYTPPAFTSVSAVEEQHTTTLPSDSVMQVVARPRVFGIKNDSCSTVTLKSDWTLMDAGANICLTGDIALLADAVSIPPLPITVALHGNGSSSFNACCMQMGYLLLTLTDGFIHWQKCFYSANAVKTIISPQAILATSNVFASWTMTGYRNSRPGAIPFDSHDGFLSMVFDLECRGGLYYCPTDIFTLGKCPSTSRLVAANLHNPIQLPLPKVHRTITSPTPPVLQRSSHFEPTSKARQLESEVWLLRLGSPGVRQLDVLPQNATGLPAVIKYHPF